MRAIVAVCRDWGIGNQGKLLVKNTADMQSFVRHTKGGTVIMGRTTLESFPGGKPLKGRKNIVLSRNPSFSREGVEVAHSVDEVLNLISSDEPNSVWVIGGASVYEQLLPYCSGALITKNDCIRPADSYFPNLDKYATWNVGATIDQGETEEQITWQIVSYENSAVIQ